MKKLLSVALLFGSAMASLPAVAATLVNANNPAPTLIGVFGPGSYTISGSGLVDLVGPVGSGFTMRPDGVPNSTVTTPGYGYFNPNGSYQADGNFGPGGSSIKIGALMGTLTATPTGPADYFLIGFSKVITFAGPTSLFAQVNDTYYPNDGGAFSVSVSSGAPEPATWGLMVLGVGLLGYAMRRRTVVRTAVTYG